MLFDMIQATDVNLSRDFSSNIGKTHLIKLSYSLKATRGRIFRHVRPFYEQAVSNLDP
jgi:hypothetical protein